MNAWLTHVSENKKHGVNVDQCITHTRLYTGCSTARVSVDLLRNFFDVAVVGQRVLAIVDLFLSS